MEKKCSILEYCMKWIEANQHSPRSLGKVCNGHQHLCLEMFTPSLATPLNAIPKCFVKANPTVWFTSCGNLTLKTIVCAAMFLKLQCLLQITNFQVNRKRNLKGRVECKYKAHEDIPNEETKWVQRNWMFPWQFQCFVGHQSVWTLLHFKSVGMHYVQQNCNATGLNYLVRLFSTLILEASVEVFILSVCSKRGTGKLLDSPVKATVV